MQKATGGVENRIRRLSRRQLKALATLLSFPHAIASSTATGKKIGIRGKSLGGVFSSLARQEVAGQPLLFPFGRGPEGRGLRWKLNTKLISQEKLKDLVGELLRY